MCGLPDSSDGKESIYNAGDLGLILGLGKTPGEENCYLTPVFLPEESHGQSGLQPMGLQRVGHS